MIIKKPAVTILKALVALVGLTTLMTTNLLFLADRAQAQPSDGQIIPGRESRPDVFNSRLQGRITSTEYNANEVPCDRITVKLMRYIPSKPRGDFGDNIGRTDKLGEVIASGENLASGCNYQISYFGSGKPVKYPYGYSSFGLLANINNNGNKTWSGRWDGRVNFNEVPGGLDLSMRYTVIR